MFDQIRRPTTLETADQHAAIAHAVESLLRVAARALGTRSVTLRVDAPWDGLVPETISGIEPFAISRELLGDVKRKRLVSIDRLSEAPAAGHLHASGFTYFGGAAVGGPSNPIGALCIASREPGRMSAAQRYVLETLAAEIADRLDAPESALAARSQSEFERQKVRLRLLESVVVNANDAVLITEAEPLDLPGPRILFANAAFTRTTGYELADILGKTPRILQGPMTSSETRLRLATALKAWQPIVVELINYRKDGSPFWVELSIVPVADEAGLFTHWVSVQRDVTDRKALEETAVRERVAEAERAALAYRAFHDDLTGLRNRAYFLERLRDQFLLNERDPSESAAVLFLDLDRFKFVNDSLGHREGDQMLVEVARRLSACVPAHDLVARLGGDEFTCLLQNVRGPNDAIAVAQRILDAFRAPIWVGGHELFAAASIGIAFVDGSRTSPEDVLRDADTAMYRAKHEGGMRYALFDASMHARAVRSLRALMELRGAIEREELVLHYQPIVELPSEGVVGYEALVRWQHPERGALSPADFIPLAEETGLIVRMGAWILREACAQSRRSNHGRPPGEPLTMSVNVSSRQLDEPNFLSELQATLRETGCDPRTLQLEITEGALIAHAESAGELLESLRRLGVRVALDDFGTGYSSLSYLERFRIDVLKIDRSFVERLATSPKTLEIVKLILGLADVLGIDVTAEGVEGVEQRDVLIRAGCSHAQGYLFGRPVPVVPSLARDARRSA